MLARKPVTTKTVNWSQKAYVDTHIQIEKNYFFWDCARARTGEKGYDRLVSSQISFANFRTFPDCDLNPGSPDLSRLAIVTKHLKTYILLLLLLLC